MPMRLLYVISIDLDVELPGDTEPYDAEVVEALNVFLEDLPENASDAFCARYLGSDLATPGSPTRVDEQER